MEMDPRDEEDFAMPEVKITELGGLIVNSVTLHRPPGSTSDDDVLAILTYALSSFLSLFVLH